jgi:hypothetical protein
MRLNDEQLSILRLLEVMGDQGLVEEVLVALTAEYFPGFYPNLKKRVKQFQKMRIIDCRPVVVMRRSGASRVQLFVLNERGKRAILAALRNRVKDVAGLSKPGVPK